MLQPLRQNPSKGQIAQALARPPPIGGWNTRDALDLLPAQDAVILDNWLPRTSWVELRKGRAVFSDAAMGSGDDVETLRSFRAGTVNKMVAASGGKVYDATAATPVELGTGYTEDRWHTHVFKSRVFAANGVDAPWQYDGSTFTAATGFTGPTLTNIIQFHSHAERIFAIEVNSTSFWYGGTGAITGALSEFDLETIAEHGGNINSMATIPSDGSKDSRDLVCFFMTTGEVIIYEGDNPGDVTAWQKIGNFKISEPIGRQNVLEFGAELLCLTDEGLLPLTRVLPMGRARPDREAISDKISGALSDALALVGDVAGWSMEFFAVGDFLFINIPIDLDNGEWHQYVMNTNTLAWCRFKNWNGYAWTVHDKKLYFGGGDGLVYQAWTGTSDDGDAIEADGATAWDYFEDRTRIKQWTLARAVFSSDGSVTHTMILNVDFNELVPAFTVSSPAVGPIWDEAIWDTVVWFGGVTTVQAWQAAANIGYVASLRIRLSTATQTVKWNSTTYQFILGGLI